MARLDYVDPATAPGPVRETFEQLPVHLNIFKIMAHAETCFRPLLRLGSTILGQQELDGRLRELAILRVARLSRAEYEWIQHVPIARSTGVTAEQIAALEKDDASAACFGPVERTVLDFTDELVRDVKVSGPTFSQARDELGARQVVELILTVGFYMTMARLMETTEIDLDPPAGTRIVEAAREGLGGLSDRAE